MKLASDDETDNNTSTDANALLMKSKCMVTFPVT